MLDSKSPTIDVLGEPNKDATYWFHPESDSFWMHDPKVDKPFPEDLKDGMSYQVSETKYVQYLIKCIDADPEHRLPEGINGIIKSGVYENNSFSGAIWYPRIKGIPNGTMVTSTQIKERKPGGICVTDRSTYLVEDING